MVNYGNSDTYTSPFFVFYFSILPLIQQVHDLPKRATLQAVSAAAASPKAKTWLKLELYDESVSPEKMGPVVSPEDSNGEVIIRYRTCGADMDDPLGLALATVDDSNIGMEVGMCISRITGKNESALYRVCFRGGKGAAVALAELQSMRKLFLDTPGLVPIVVSVRSVVMP